MQHSTHYFVIDHSGPTRCMLESNFPVDKFSASYGLLWNSFKTLTKDFSPSERTALFHDKASPFYGV